MYNISIKTDATTEPVTQAQIVNYIKYDETDATELVLIMLMVKAARQLIEKYLNVSLVEKTYQLSFDASAVDSNYLKLPYGPLITFTSLTYYDADGDDEAVTDYQLKGLFFKEMFLQFLNADGYYVAEFISGYDSHSEVLPTPLFQAICELVKYWYDRGDGTRNLPESVVGMIAPYSKNLWI